MTHSALKSDNLGNWEVPSTLNHPSDTETLTPREISITTEDRTRKSVTRGDLKAASGHHAGMFVRALQNIILPIVCAQLEDSDKGTSINLKRLEDGEIDPESSLGIEAQDLIAALERFISATVRSGSQRLQSNDRDEGQEVSLDDEISIGKEEIPGRDKPAVNAGLILVDSKHITPERQSSPLLHMILERLRQRVFNKMPIRLLSFNLADGSGIELLERGAVWGRISSVVKASFNEENVKSDIQRLLDRWGGNKIEAEKKVIDNFASQHTRYAILSHTWIHDAPGEVIYTNWRVRGFSRSCAGYQKLANFCRIAATDHGVSLGWMDTVCINKESSAELDESIRSMYKWYCDAHICITYLAQTASLGEAHADPWFTRGWTLQELLAPRRIKFYGAEWSVLSSGTLDDKTNKAVQEEIQRATTISPNELNQIRYASFRDIPISRRMQLAAPRQVTREEDSAYALMGLFNVSMPTAYGEGAECAFFRLVKEILASSKAGVIDIANWGSGPSRIANTSAQSSLIPSSPAQYLWRQKFDRVWRTPTTPITLTHLGLQLPVLLMPALSVDQAGRPFAATGAYSATADIGTANEPKYPWNSIPQIYNVLESNISGPSGWNSTHTRFQITFGVLNVTGNNDSVCLPARCFAVGLYFRSNNLGEAVASSNILKISTAEAIAFDLRFQGDTTQKSSSSILAEVKHTELGQHGIQLLTMYL